MELVAVKDASWEQEGNDSIREATVLTQNTDCNGNLYYADDVDYYKYTVAETGYFNLDFSVTDITAETGSGWGVTFYNAKDGSEIYYKGIKESTTFPTFNFAKGTDVYVKVSRWEGHTDESVPDSVQYTLNVVSVKNNAWEQESNDTVKTASPLKANTLNTANLYHCDDEDYYVYKTANDGYFNLRMAFADLTADFGSGLSITAYNASDNTELWHFNMKGTGSITLPTSYFKKGTSVIFKVARVDGYTDASVPAFVPYTLKIDFTKTSYAEKESFQTAEESWSKRKKNATKMTSKKKYVGNLWNGTDNDLYTLKMKKNGALNLKFNPNEPEDVLKNGYTVTLYNAKGKAVYELSGKTVLSKKVSLKKGTYYAEVRATLDYSAPIGMEYTLSASY